MSDDLVKRLRDSTAWYHADCELKMNCADRIEELEAKLAKAVEAERERCAKIADKCKRDNGPLSNKGFNEQYRRGLEAAGQAIAAAIRAELTGGQKDE